METQHKTQPSQKKYRRKVVFWQPCLHKRSQRSGGKFMHSKVVEFTVQSRQ